MTVKIIERDVSKAELQKMLDDFNVLQLHHGVPVLEQERCGFVAEDHGKFVGLASGLIHHHWFYLTDLWLEKPYRRQGWGSVLLTQLEEKIKIKGVNHIYTWTASYEAPPFYKNCGYEIFCELENYYPNGHHRIGLRKTL
ncbi:MAG: GNAT family N-acetyltransferase [Alphaproteobacteria bacterium]